MINRVELRSVVELEASSKWVVYGCEAWNCYSHFATKREEASLNTTQLRLSQPMHVIFLVTEVSSEVDTGLELVLKREYDDFCSMIGRT